MVGRTLRCSRKQPRIRLQQSVPKRPCAINPSTGPSMPPHPALVTPASPLPSNEWPTRRSTLLPTQRKLSKAIAFTPLSRPKHGLASTRRVVPARTIRTARLSAAVAEAIRNPCDSLRTAARLKNPIVAGCRIHAIPSRSARVRHFEQVSRCRFADDCVAIFELLTTAHNLAEEVANVVISPSERTRVSCLGFCS